MKLERLAYSPGPLVDFYDEAFTSLGALCERTWHDRLELVADGDSARLWNDTGALHEVELWFPPPGDTSAREAATEVFPGCPLTFQLAEALRPAPLALERVVLNGDTLRPPAADVAEKLWRAQFPKTRRCQLCTPFAAATHHSLLALVRCEIQAIDQHWSLRRVAVSLPDGELDEALAKSLDLTEIAANPGVDEQVWPRPEPARWRELLAAALQTDLAADLATIRARQAHHLGRELGRVDDYFEHYEQELATRAGHTRSETTKLKAAERLAAAKAEHTRRRADQVARHEIRALAHLEALLLIAEPAWQAGLQVTLAHQAQTLSARFIPRTRRWLVLNQTERA